MEEIQKERSFITNDKIIHKDIKIIYRLYKQKKIPRYNNIRECVKIIEHFNASIDNSIIYNYLFSRYNINDKEEILKFIDNDHKKLYDIWILCKSWDFGFVKPDYVNANYNKIQADELKVSKIENYKRKFLLPLLTDIKNCNSKNEIYINLANYYLKLTTFNYRDMIEKDILQSMINRLTLSIIVENIEDFKNELSKLIVNIKCNYRKSISDFHYKKRRR